MGSKTDTIEKAALLDRSDILGFLFHPRRPSGTMTDDRIEEITVSTTDNASIGCRLHLGGKDNPTILFFHGNGEIAHDYDPIGPVYLSFGLNFIVADYRGYGISTGKPGVSAMLRDAYAVFDKICTLLEQKGHRGPLWVMGRSLGSAPAIEIAANRDDSVAGLIVESGFAGINDLLARLGILPRDLMIDEAMLFSNADGIRHFNGPVMIIHAEHDHIIPLEHGRLLFESAPTPRKTMKTIGGADHNNIFALAGMSYFQDIHAFIAHHGDGGAG